MSKIEELETLIEFDGEFDRETYGIMKLWYEYMHSSRRILPNAPSTLLKVWVDYFDADWIGLIDIDEECGTWSVKCFYNRHTGSFSETSINPEGENILKVPHWIEAVRANEPIYVGDAEELKDTCPEEYEICQRFRMHNVLGTPYRNCRFGFMVVKNPRKHVARYDILNLMCSVLTHEINDANRRKAALYYSDGFEPKTYDDVNLYLFGEFLIRTKGLYMTGADVGSDFMRFVIAILAMNPDRSYTGAELSDIYFGDTGDRCEPKYVISRFKNRYKEWHPLHDDDYQLIVSGKGGYRINPNLNVVPDTKCAKEHLHILKDTLDKKTKLELLEKWFKSYRGSFMAGTGDDCCWIIEKRVAYEEEYLSFVLEYFTLLMDEGQYDLAEQLANEMLAVFPGNYNFYMIKLAAQMERKKFLSLSATVSAASKALPVAEKQVLFAMICDKFEMPSNHHGMIKAALKI